VDDHTRIPLLLSICIALSVSANAGPNLVPGEPATAPNYWCTWYAQNYWIGRGSDLDSLDGVTNPAAQDEINYDVIFDPEEGWATTYLPRGRSDYIFLIDHGWQTKEEEERIAGGPKFFNMVADPRDFPPYADLHPRDRLKRFNEEIKALGWNSLGLWVRGNVTEEQARTFVEWSKYAGIHYWKIDGGNDGGNYFSTRVKEDIYPELVLEYITGAGGNINPKWNEKLPSYPSVYDFGGRLRKPMLDMLQNTDTFRTYDASPLLMSSTTLRRTHDILKQVQQQPEYRAVLNVQDDCNVAVGLGVLVASKRHPNMNERTYKGKDLHHQLSGPRMMQKRINEAERFGRWARIAPAFPAGEGVYLYSEQELIDRCEFTPWDTWATATYGKMVSQSAPAIMARNMPLPVVEIEGEPPYVCATTYPNGPTGIATEGRVSPENRWFHPRAKVTVQIKDASQPIGIVGHYQELVLEFADSIESVDQIWAQDLLATKSVDIINQVKISGNRLTLPGDLIDRIGTSAGDEGDLSAPGMVLQLDGKDLPVAGDAFTPVVDIARLAANPIVENDGYRGTASVKAHTYGFKLTPTGSANEPSFALRQLPEPILSGKLSIRWRMKDIDPEAATRNGFIVLSSDEDAQASVFAGAWTGSQKLAIFEGISQFRKATLKPFQPGMEMNCQLDLDLDSRKATLTINGVSEQRSISESVTGLNYIGFGVRGASTLFTEPEMTRGQTTN
jgi:hypothetical protein